MNKTKKYYGILAFIAALIIFFAAAYLLVVPRNEELVALRTKVASMETEVANLKQSKAVVQAKIKKINDSLVSAQKKIYSPIESDLSDDDTLFFTLYNDVIEMVHANSVKIKSIDYQYNPETDAFVKSGKDTYFVCDVNMELVSNYVNLGKLIQDLYQYPYYIKINELEVDPYKKDKKILLSKLSLRLYAHTIPEENDSSETTTVPMALDGADTALPQ